MVVYKSKMTHRKIKGGKKNFGIYAAQEFIASITQHIPDKNFQLVRYYGWYSNRMSGDRLKIEQVVHENQQQELGDVIEVID
ncbi:MAG: transposase, partial [Deltaproteobacteria bacterium]|nr:transposase [Deltaproteobacteria bacterium]